MEITQKRTANILKSEVFTKTDWASRPDKGGGFRHSETFGIQCSLGINIYLIQYIQYTPVY